MCFLILFEGWRDSQEHDLIYILHVARGVGLVRREAFHCDFSTVLDMGERGMKQMLLSAQRKIFNTVWTFKEKCVCIVVSVKTICLLSEGLSPW